MNALLGILFFVAAVLLFRWKRPKLWAKLAWTIGKNCL